MSDRWGRNFEQSVEISGYRRKLSRRELAMRRDVLECLADGPKTIPEIARSLDVSTHEVMWWVMGFVRFGYIKASERADADGYYTYELSGEGE